MNYINQRLLKNMIFKSNMLINEPFLSPRHAKVYGSPSTVSVSLSLRGWFGRAAQVVLTHSLENVWQWVRVPKCHLEHAFREYMTFSEGRALWIFEGKHFLVMRISCRWQEKTVRGCLFYLYCMNGLLLLTGCSSIHFSERKCIYGW